MRVEPREALHWRAERPVRPGGHNNALPGPGLIQPRRPYGSATFLPGTVFPDGVTVVSNTIPVSAVNWLENTAQSWYDAGYVNLRRRYSGGLSLLANYTYAKNLSDAPDFRSPMFEAAIPQNNQDLRSEKGPSCDIRHRFALSTVYDVHSLTRWNWSRAASRNAQQWFNPLAFSAPAPYTFGNTGRNTVYGPGQQTLDLALARVFAVSETARFQLRLEAFNALNKVNLGTPNRFVNTAQFGTITESSTPGRQIQVSARFSF